ncbi:hypothetical protein GW17_00008684 [Ensete ventricosum]|uniref:Uncharacterized protein n=1 Tax=Ensete ventricosum TaxID=4639 RepID=A0A444FWB5_ENSVE|nr:hypothetical protein B296_00024844 [Ensete ventricosum]RWW26908.1 hypothetical protein GW17_00008684 [Ensete ventricosum]
MLPPEDGVEMPYARRRSESTAILETTIHEKPLAIIQTHLPRLPHLSSASQHADTACNFEIKMLKPGRRSHSSSTAAELEVIKQQTAFCSRSLLVLRLTDSEL